MFRGGSVLALAVVGFLVGGHYMCWSGQSTYASMVFSALSYLVAIPSAIKVFNWTATLHKGQISFEAPMLYALGFIGLFLFGGLTGLFLAATALDVHLTDEHTSELQSLMRTSYAVFCLKKKIEQHTLVTAVL